MTPRTLDVVDAWRARAEGASEIADHFRQKYEEAQAEIDRLKRDLEIKQDEISQLRLPVQVGREVLIRLLEGRAIEYETGVGLEPDMKQLSDPRFLTLIKLLGLDEGM